jgi:hypothetical protein
MTDQRASGGPQRLATNDEVSVAGPRAADTSWAAVSKMRAARRLQRCSFLKMICIKVARREAGTLNSECR